MKKILVAIALVIVMATLLMLPVAGADNDNLSVEELIKWNVTDSIHYIGKPTTTPPTQDGNIRKNEYAYSFRMSDPIFPCTIDHNYNKIGYSAESDFSSNYVEYFVSYDEDYVYVGIYDDQNQKIGKRVNFFVNYGIDPENVMSLTGSPNQLIVNGNTGTAFYKGSDKTKDENYISVNGKLTKYVDTLCFASGDDGYGGYDTVYEFKISRADALEIFNGTKGTGFVENPDVFMFTTYVFQYGDYYSAYRWCGKALSNVEKMNLGTKQDYIPSIFVLAEEGDDFLGKADLEVPTKPAETETPTTEAPTTEPVTEAPTTEPVTETPETEAPTTEPVTEAPETEAPATEAPAAEGGCGSSVAAMGIALVAVLGTCATVVSKKKED